MTFETTKFPSLLAFTVLGSSVPGGSEDRNAGLIGYTPIYLKFNILPFIGCNQTFNPIPQPLFPMIAPLLEPSASF